MLSVHIGAMHELIAAADLCRRGFVAYRALSPAAAYDLIITRADGSNPLSVEVKTYHPRRPHAAPRSLPCRPPSRADILATVTTEDGAPPIVRYRGMTEAGREVLWAQLRREWAAEDRARKRQRGS